MEGAYAHTVGGPLWVQAVKFQQNVALAPYTTFGIGGPARWFATAAFEEDVEEAVAFAQRHSLRIFVLGGGSNLLVSDAGFDGLVLHIAVQGIESRRVEDTVLLTVGAGESWDGLVQYTVDHNLAGMECLAGIPGTVGGTPVQNVGAYGQDVAETIRTVRCFDTHASTFVQLANEQCGFAYRTSLLNTTERGRYIITRVEFALQPGGMPKLAYPDLRKRFTSNTLPSLPETAAAVREIRQGKSMVIDPADPNTRSAGSFFRNPVVASSLLPNLAESTGMQPGEIPHWPAGDSRIKLPAAWLLERAGFTRGYALGAAGISSRHTLAMINRGDALCADIVTLRDRIIDTVQQRFGITLEQEPVSLG